MMSHFRKWKNTSNLQIFETFHGLSATPDRDHELKFGKNWKPMSCLTQRGVSSLELFQVPF